MFSQSALSELLAWRFAASAFVCGRLCRPVIPP
jgi:hypothetical protein